MGDTSKNERKAHPLPSPPDSIKLSYLAPERLEYLERFVSTILSSSAAERTYAQLIDGLPTRASFQRCSTWEPTFTAIVEREAPSPNAIELFRSFRQQLQVSQIKIDLVVRQPCT